jgi:hypothetical protein
MEVAVVFAALKGVRSEAIVKELAVAGKYFIQSCNFKSPYPATPKILDNNESNPTGVHWDDGHITYTHLATVLDEATARFIHLYAFGADKCAFLSDLINCTFINLEEFRCPTPEKLEQHISCCFNCHRFNPIYCTNRSAHGLYKWNVYDMQAKDSENVLRIMIDIMLCSFQLHR